MTFVLRRKMPRHDGSRYFAKPSPVQYFLEHARKFENADGAEVERRNLREPWLWEVLDQQEAARLDAEETNAFQARMSREAKAEARARPLLTSMLAFAALGGGLALPGDRR